MTEYFPAVSAGEKRDTVEFIKSINILIAFLFLVCYSYQVWYLVVPFFKKRKPVRRDAPPHRFAILIAARNEERVIANLIDSIHQQEYPSEMVTVFVGADNCTDSTAETARKAGAVVYERHNLQQIGKGYVLDFLIQNIWKDYPRNTFDAFIVLDADNLLDPHYLSAINAAFSEGHPIITSYRNSKNYGQNWISAGYALWFLRESQYLNRSRMLLSSSCAISGTGFLVSREIIEQDGGWKNFLLTEDIEFSIQHILQGYSIAYCEDAVLYDEQPVKFSQSWRQRMRWAKGFFQVWGCHGRELIRTFFCKRCFACYDMIMTIMPALFLSLADMVICIAWAVMSAGKHIHVFPLIAAGLFDFIADMYLPLFLIGVITVITEWKQIHCPGWKKLLYSFTFPLFMMTYIPIAFCALFRKVEWKPIEHSCNVPLSEVCKK